MQGSRKKVAISTEDIENVGRQSCSIGLEDHVVVTGGYWHYRQQATKYDRTGWLEDLPSLTTGRENHGCAWYRSDGGTLVTYLLLMTSRCSNVVRSTWSLGGDLSLTLMCSSSPRRCWRPAYPLPGSPSRLCLRGWWGCGWSPSTTFRSCSVSCHNTLC